MSVPGAATESIWVKTFVPVASVLCAAWLVHAALITSWIIKKRLPARWRSWVVPLNLSLMAATVLLGIHFSLAIHFHRFVDLPRIHALSGEAERVAMERLHATLRLESTVGFGSFAEFLICGLLFGYALKLDRATQS
jgi:hypothetical protein